MKTSREFFDRLRTDKDFTAKVRDAAAAKKKAGATDAFEAMIAIAADEGYELTRETLEKFMEDNPISEEELGKVAGGFCCLPIIIPMVFMTAVSIYESIDATLNDF